MTTGEAFRSMGRAIAGMAVLAAFVLTAIGTLMILADSGYWLFFVATAVCLVFAARPMWRVMRKYLLCE